MHHNPNESPDAWAKRLADSLPTKENESKNYQKKAQNRLEDTMNKAEDNFYKIDASINAFMGDKPAPSKEEATLLKQLNEEIDLEKKTKTIQSSQAYVRHAPIYTPETKQQNDMQRLDALIPDQKRHYDPNASISEKMVAIQRMQKEKAAVEAKNKADMNADMTRLDKKYSALKETKSFVTNAEPQAQKSREQTELEEYAQFIVLTKKSAAENKEPLSAQVSLMENKLKNYINTTKTDLTNDHKNDPSKKTTLLAELKELKTNLNKHPAMSKPIPMDNKTPAHDAKPKNVLPQKPLTRSSDAKNSPTWKKPDAKDRYETRKLAAQKKQDLLSQKRKINADSFKEKVSTTMSRMKARRERSFNCVSIKLS